MNNKIFLVHYSSSPGGIEVLMPVIINMLPDKDFFAFVIRPPVKGSINVYKNTTGKVIYGSENNFIAAFRLWKFARKNKKSLFHGFNLGPFFLLIIRLAGCNKVVYSVRGTIHYNTPFQKLCRRILWWLAVSENYRFIANSEYSLEKLMQFVRLDRSLINIIYNPISSDCLHFHPRKRNLQPFKIIYAGRLAEGKNLFTWLEVAASVKKVSPESKFLLYGDGPLKTKLKNYANKLGISDSVEFMGFTSDMVTAYSKADLFIFLSNHESFGNVVVESILCGTPVIASDIPAMREIFTNYPQVLVPLDGNLINNIIEKMNQIDQLTELIPKMIVEFQTRFSAEDHIVKLRNIYNSFYV